MYIHVTYVYICDCSSQVDSHFLMNSILESADPGRVNGFLAAFPDRGFGTAEFFSVPWPATAWRFPVDGSGSFETMSGRILMAEAKRATRRYIRKQYSIECIISVIRIHKKNT